MAEASTALRAPLLASLGLGKALHEINDVLFSFFNNANNICSINMHTFIYEKMMYWKVIGRQREDRNQSY